MTVRPEHSSRIVQLLGSELNLFAQQNGSRRANSQLEMIRGHLIVILQIICYIGSVLALCLSLASHFTLG